MLVLTRKVGEEVCIGEFIKIQIKAIKGKQVQIAFDVPKIFPILRAEVKRKKQKITAFSS